MKNLETTEIQIFIIGSYINIFCISINHKNLVLPNDKSSLYWKFMFAGRYDVLFGVISYAH